MRHNMLVIVGATATGKSALAVKLALALDAEIVSADSMQVYRHFNIGTGKLTHEEQCGVAHHLIDIVSPHSRFSAADFVREADAVLADLQQRGRFAIVVGGSGLYVRALLRGLFDAPPSDPAIRERHRLEADSLGVLALWERLRQRDPESADKINPNDFVRISRALEICEQTQTPASQLRKQHGFAEKRYETTIVGLRFERDELRRTIDDRVDAMMSDGWLEEVRQLCDAGYADTHAMKSLGYQQLDAHLRGEFDLEEAVRQTKRDTWRFAKRQRNWFSHDTDVIWMDGKAGTAALCDEVERVMRSSSS